MDALYVEYGVVPFRAEDHRRATEGLLETKDAGTVLVVVEGEDLVGYAVVTWGYSLEYGGRDAFLDELYVSPSHRRRGVARPVLDDVEAACRDRGVRVLHLEVERSNGPAQRLYRTYGFADHDRYLMTKRFQEKDPVFPSRS